MSKVKEIREKRAAILKEMENLIAKDPSTFTSEEKSLWGAKKNEYDDLGSALEIAEQQEALARVGAEGGASVSKGDKQAFEKYSFRRAILMNLGYIPLEGVEREMHEEAMKEATAESRMITGVGVPYALMASRRVKGLQGRASTGQNVTTVGEGGYLVQDEAPLFIDALRDALILPGLGANFITGLKGDMPFNEGGLFTASWLAEDGADTDQKLAFTQLVGKPHRLQATGAFSRQLLMQSSPAIDMLVEKELISSIALALQLAAINGSGQNNQPTGILNTVGIGSVVGGTTGAAPDWADVINLEKEVDQDNAMGANMAYIINAKTRAFFKQTEKTSGNALYIWENGNTVNGYQVGVTNAVPSNLTKSTGDNLSAIIFGNMAKLYMLGWGGLEIIADPYSLKKKAEIETTCISYNDIIVQNPKAFSAMKDAAV